MLTDTLNDEGFPKLTAQDRCDRCSARAAYRVANFALAAELMFCRHHYLEHEHALILQCFEVVS